MKKIEQLKKLCKELNIEMPDVPSVVLPPDSTIRRLRKEAESLDSGKNYIIPIETLHIKVKVNLSSFNDRSGDVAMDILNIIPTTKSTPLEKISLPLLLNAEQNDDASYFLGSYLEATDIYKQFQNRIHKFNDELQQLEDDYPTYNINDILLEFNN